MHARLVEDGIGVSQHTCTSAAATLRLLTRPATAREVVAARVASMVALGQKTSPKPETVQVRMPDSLNR